MSDVENLILDKHIELQKLIVAIIKNITRFEVPVIFDDENAKYGQGSYAGFLGFEEIIAPDLEEMPYADFYDCLEEKHLFLYHVGLANPITIPKNKYVQKVISDIFVELQIEFIPINYMVFIILHEFGHAYEFFVEMDKDIITYTKRMHERESVLYELRYFTEDELKKQLDYRKFSSEKYADDFAKKHIHEVLKKIKERELVYA